MVRRAGAVLALVIGVGCSHEPVRPHVAAAPEPALTHPSGRPLMSEGWYCVDSADGSTACFDTLGSCSNGDPGENGNSACTLAPAASCYAIRATGVCTRTLTECESTRASDPDATGPCLELRRDGWTCGEGGDPPARRCFLYAHTCEVMTSACEVQSVAYCLDLDDARSCFATMEECARRGDTCFAD